MDETVGSRQAMMDIASYRKEESAPTAKCNGIAKWSGSLNGRSGNAEMDLMESML
jgi:hypothetical protein